MRRCCAAVAAFLAARLPFSRHVLTMAMVEMLPWWEARIGCPPARLPTCVMGHLYRCLVGGAAAIAALPLSDGQAGAGNLPGRRLAKAALSIHRACDDGWTTRQFPCSRWVIVLWNLPLAALVGVADATHETTTVAKRVHFVVSAIVRASPVSGPIRR